uniref:NADH-ubiquinone oxidoreductase chain 2 n=1 Tax=Proales similis TaxID=360698 RepID=A0A7D4WWS7_9BILA|nr:NADH dehydrogenase subunit 2 [Proales similis]
MFLMFTPYTFIFSFIYLLLLISLFFISDFYLFWLIMEVVMLLFMGVSYTIFTHSFSYLMIYFLIQTIASFSILLFYMCDFSTLLLFSFLLKLGLFPFHGWFINVSRRFPNLLLYIISTFHKLPVFIMMDYFLNFSSIEVLILFCSLNFLVCGFTMMNSTEFRTILVLSSVANNSWFILSCYFSFFLFLVFFFFYSLLMFLLLSNLSTLNNLSFSSYSSSSTFSGALMLLMMSGMPPFPIFFCKMGVFYFMVSTFSFTFFTYLFILSSVVVFVGYYRLLVKYFIYSHTPSYFLYTI